MSRFARGRGGAAALALLLAGVAHAAAEPARGDPAARLLPTEQASDTWDLTVRTDEGCWIVAQTTISNIGPGDNTAAIVGHVIDPEGGTHAFTKVRRDGDWELSKDRRRFDLGSIVFDQSGPTTILHVDKKRVDMDLRIDLSGQPAWSEALDPGDGGFDLLALAAPVAGTMKLGEDQEAFAVQGRAFLTHRWKSLLEARTVKRRVELFAFEKGVGVYFVERTDPSGASRRWLVTGRDGRIWNERDGVEVRYSVRAQGGSLSLASPDLSGSATLDGILLRDEPLQRAPLLARWWYGRVMRPRFVWSAAPFEFRLQDPEGGEDLRISGQGLVDVSRFDPGRAKQDEETEWGER
jgi:hypothetical protein